MTNTEKIEKIIELFDETPDFALHDDEFHRRLMRILEGGIQVPEMTNEAKVRIILTQIRADRLHEETRTQLEASLLSILNAETYTVTACVYCAGGLVVNAGEPGWIVRIVKPEECEHSHHEDAPEPETWCNCGGSQGGNHHRESCPKYTEVEEQLRAAQTKDERCAYFYPNARKLCNRLRSNHVYKDSGTMTGRPVAHDFVSPQTFSGRT